MDDDKDTDGNGINGTDDCNEDDFNDTFIVDDQVVSSLSLTPNPCSGEDHAEVCFISFDFILESETC